MVDFATQTDFVPQRLMILVNPGEPAHSVAQEIMAAGQRMNLAMVEVRLEQVWAMHQQDPQQLINRIVGYSQEMNVGAVLAVDGDGLVGFPGFADASGTRRSFFEALELPHLMLWTEPPHRAAGQMALHDEVRPFLQRDHLHHFIPGESAAQEARRLLGFANAHGTSIAAEPRIYPSQNARPLFDVVTVCSSKPNIPYYLTPFLDVDDPDVFEMGALVVAHTRRQLQQIYGQCVPSLAPALMALADDWIDAKAYDGTEAPMRIFESLGETHCEAYEYLCKHPRLYYHATAAMRTLGNWLQDFTPAFLSKYFSVGIFGADCSAYGCGGNPSAVDIEQIPTICSQGRVVLARSDDAGEECVGRELMHCAAGGAPLIHVQHPTVQGLFRSMHDIEFYRTPLQARWLVEQLLNDPVRRQQQAKSAFQRLHANHSWGGWLRSAFRNANLPISAFTVKNTVPAGLRV